MRLGLFGGTFDPPHLGHLALANAACDQLNLERVLWILSGIQPLKIGQPITPPEHRLKMLELALQGQPHFVISSVELECPGPHYSVDTVRLLAERYPKDELIFLMGGDSLRDLPRWHSPADLVAACAEIGVMRRPGDALDLAALERQIPGLTAKVRFIHVPLVDISASQIRRQVAAGEDVSRFLLPSVYAYIQQYGLYQNL